jgi:hypothetical protein
MKAYLIAVETAHDEVMFAEYRKQVVDTIKPSGGSLSLAAARRPCSKVSGSIPALSSSSFRRESRLKAGINLPTTKK